MTMAGHTLSLQHDTLQCYLLMLRIAAMQVCGAARKAVVLLCCSLEKRSGIHDLGFTQLQSMCLRANVMPLLASQLETCLDSGRTELRAPLTDVSIYIKPNILRECVAKSQRVQMLWSFRML